MDDKNLPIEARFERHLLVYSEDKKRLEESMAAIHNDITTAQNEILELVRPMAEIFSGSKFTFKFITGTLKFVALVGGGIGALYVIRTFIEK